MFVSLALTLLMSCGPAAAEPAPGQRRGDQVEAFEARKQGKLMSLPEIERRVIPLVPNSQYIGVELDSFTGIYTLKFLRNGNVIWVDVDGRSGQVMRRTGN